MFSINHVILTMAVRIQCHFVSGVSSCKLETDDRIRANLMKNWDLQYVHSAHMMHDHITTHSGSWLVALLQNKLVTRKPPVGE